LKIKTEEGGSHPWLEMACVYFKIYKETVYILRSIKRLGTISYTFLREWSRTSQKYNITEYVSNMAL
jgi:hypothetical protein